MTVLTRPTLVLNKHWVAVNVATVASVLKKVWAENATIVDPHDYAQYSWSDWTAMRPEDGDPYIQLPGYKLRVPEVVTVAHYDKIPASKLAFSRKNLFRRDKCTCQYCGKQPGTKDLTIDHVHPKSRGGKSTWENCVLACIRCNHRKADRTPREARMKLLKEPVAPPWRPTYHTGIVLDSWDKFVSEMHWNVPLEE